MTTSELLNKSKAANFLIGDYMVWKHSQGWSATNIRTQEYFLDMEDWDRNKTHMSDKKGRNYWTDVESMLKQLEKNL